MKAKRGQKVCKACDQINGVRSYNCKKCGEPFKMKCGKVRRKNVPIENWQALKPGQLIKVKHRSGSFHINSDGDKTYLSVPGEYQIREVDGEGLHVVGTTSRNYGYTFIYMGTEKQSRILDSIYRSPHKITHI